MKHTKEKNKRIVIHKPKDVPCGICKKDISLYSLSSHIKWSHFMTSDEYANQYGEFRKNKKPTTRNIKKIKCQLCDIEFSSVGLFTHLRDSHDTTPDDYVTKYGEYRPSKLRQIDYSERLETASEEEKQKCVICNSEFASGILLGYHIKNIHGLEKKQYIKKHVFNGVHPVCKCGCGKNVKVLHYYPYKVNYVSGHNNCGETNPMFGKKHKGESKLKMSEKAIKRIESGIGKTIDTKPELQFKSLLDKLNIDYKHPYEVDLGYRKASIDFYLFEKNLLVEIDGEYWHPDTLENLTLHLLPNVISDKQREVLRENLRRIKSLDLVVFDKVENADEFYKLINEFVCDETKYTLKYKQVVLNKKYLRMCLEKKGADYLKSYSWLLLKFIRLFQPTLPSPSLEEEFSDVVDRISKYNFSKVYFDGVFHNNISTVGHNYLKYYFKSYWKSAYKGSKSPEDCWLDDALMKKIIEYRIGCNTSDEVYDFSMYQMVRGLSANRKTVSFFKPTLAAGIYKHYLKDNDFPVVLDPCCGFGGRLLGFKSVYPNGKYIGCEPNVETYNELIQMVDREKFTDVTIYNCKFEDYKDTKDVDFTFTSIPYFDLELYSNVVTYEDFNHWRNTFIKSIESCNNCYINTSIDLAKELKWNIVDSYIVSSGSHFDKKNGLPTKNEVIVKLP